MSVPNSPDHATCCTLCGLRLQPQSYVLRRSDQALSFCCMGCKQVYIMLAEATGSTDPAELAGHELFERCRQMGLIPRSQADLRAWSPEQIKGAAKPAPPTPSTGTLTLNLSVADMWCPACAWVIEKALGQSPGIIEASCNFTTDRLRCVYDPVQTAPLQIEQIIAALGYRTALPEETAALQGRKAQWLRFGISAFLTLNVMMLSVALYTGFWAELSPDAIHHLSWPMAVMSSVVLFFGGMTIYRRAWAGLSNAAFSMETLITIGAFSAYLYSLYGLLTGSLHLYFDTVAMLITLVLLGKLLEARVKRRIQDDLESFFALSPTKVKICTATSPEGHYTAARHLAAGDLFVVEQDEVVAADGVIVDGQAMLDESSLTGEPVPIRVRAGQRVRSGTRCTEGRLKVRAEAVGPDATLGQMIHIMQEALGRKSPLESKTDRLLQKFVPAILILALATGAACLLAGHPGAVALIRAVTVVLISCPCALGLAIPLARVAGVAAAAKQGLLVRDFDAFEQAENATSVVFDKTGTITQGQWRLLDTMVFAPVTLPRALSLAAGLEQASDHLVASEIKRYAQAQQVAPAAIDQLQVYDNGVKGRHGQVEVKIGAAGFLADEIQRATQIRSWHNDGETSRRSLVYLGLDGTLGAVFLFGDTIKKSAPPAVQALAAEGYEMALVSGDGPEATGAIAAQVGLETYRGGLLPQEKVAFVQQLQQKGQRVVMVGDGVNDAPAMAQADLAVAVHAGSHLGRELADVTLMRGEPGQLPEFLALAKAVNRKIHQNLLFTFLYNVISIPLAMGGWLTPLVAVCAMLMSSLSVTGNTYLLTRAKKSIPARAGRAASA